MNYSEWKDYLTGFLLSKMKITERQARISAIKLYQTAKTLGLYNGISTDRAVHSLLSAITGPPKPYKPKTFEIWFLERETKRMKCCI
jgi:hypothetical protein